MKYGIDVTINVTALRLVANELSEELPAALGNLTNLEDLYLSQNILSRRLPRTLSALPQLLVLDIREARLCAPADSAFRAWMATIDFQGTVCACPPPPPPLPPNGVGRAGEAKSVGART